MCEKESEVEQKEEVKAKNHGTSQVIHPPPPFPQKLQKQKLEKQFQKFINVFKKLHINIPFAKAFEQMPSYVKFLKDILSKKRKLGKFETVSLTEECSAILQNKLPPKLKDPVDFIILDMEEDRQILIILGRPFLATARALIDVEKVNNLTHDVFLEENPNDLLETCLVANYDRDDDEFIDYSNLLNAHSRFRANHQFESLDISTSLVPASKPSIKEPPILELKPLPTHLRYAFLGKSSNLSVIIFYALTSLQQEKLLRTLREFKKAIGWTIVDIKGISPSICMHKILLEEDHKATIEQQRRLNPIMKEVVKKEIMKWLDVEIIYPISDSSWVSLVQCVPKKRGMTVVANDNNELIPTRTVIGWRVCMDYRKLNKATRKDHFPLPFIDQMLDRLAGKEYYCFLDGYSGYNQIAIALEDQEKTTFTCPYGTFAFRRMPFGLCNALATFQRCMMAIFTNMVEKCLEVFMDDFSVFGNNFDDCLLNLARVVKRCEKRNLVLHWEKCHFMVREGIVLGHKISSNGIEVDKAKIEAIEKLPPPINVKGIRSFLGHASFYRRFIKDFSKISKSLCNLLEKDVPFKFDN
ncbi:PREDICTED: uncharacterized protein LOC108661939 [Theobroma cacao]|uniref:Uncharacterized protein LOC108661939 n=1 Tax=Theobroma cacao TaxID=3641 RepID=A0AB32WEG1_THECC|nr:PREDICTED: uncharacterized protein LOC108661939 [Theobroma cacao]